MPSNEISKTWLYHGYTDMICVYLAYDFYSFSKLLVGVFLLLPSYERYVTMPRIPIIFLTLQFCKTLVCSLNLPGSKLFPRILFPGNLK